MTDTQYIDSTSTSQHICDRNAIRLVDGTVKCGICKRFLYKYNNTLNARDAE